MRKKILQIGIGTVVLLILAALIFGYYYWKTSPKTVVFVSGPFPPNFSPGFTPEQLVDYLLASIEDIRIVTESTIVPTAHGGQPDLGLQVAHPSEKTGYTSFRIPLPAFDIKVRGINAGMLRQWAVSIKARRFISIDTTTTGGSSFRLLGILQDRPDFATRYSWRIPVAGDSCLGPEKCTSELAEEVLTVIEPHPLILFYLQRGDENSFHKVVKLYQSENIPRSNLKNVDYLAWGDALRGIGEYDQAINKYREGVEKDPRFCPAYDAIGFTYLLKYEAEMSRIEHLNAADSSYRQALSCDQNDAVAHCDLGNVLIRKWTAGNRADAQLVEQAIGENKKALEIDPQRAEAAVNIGYAQYMRGNHDQALEYFRDISAKFPRNTALFVNFGFLLYREYLNGNTDLLQAALDKTKRAWELNQGSYVAANNLGFLYFETGALPDAVKYWKEAYRLNPSDPDVLFGLALGLFKSGQRDEAVIHCREAIRRGGSNMKDPEYLRQKHFWSQKAAEEVMPLIQAATAGA
jgi:tetratricopeptide (TPR) repeat protein